MQHHAGSNTLNLPHSLTQAVVFLKVKVVFLRKDFHYRSSEIMHKRVNCSFCLSTHLEVSCCQRNVSYQKSGFYCYDGELSESETNKSLLHETRV